MTSRLFELLFSFKKNIQNWQIKLTVNWTLERKLSRVRGEATRKAPISQGRRSGKTGQKDKRPSAATEVVCFFLSSLRGVGQPAKLGAMRGRFSE
jgi:hypothetical protein